MIKYLEHALDESISELIADARRRSLLSKLENRLDNGKFSGGGVETAECYPIVDDHSSTDELGSSIDRSSDDWNLEQRGELSLCLWWSTGGHEASVRAECTVTADKRVLSETDTEHFDFQDFYEGLLSLCADFGMNNSHMVITSDDVSQSGETLIDTTNGDFVWKGVSEMLKFLVCGGVWNEKSVAVSNCESSDDSGRVDGGVNDRDQVAEFGLQNTVEILGATDADKAVTVGERAEDADVVGSFVVNAKSHG